MILIEVVYEEALAVTVAFCTDAEGADPTTEEVEVCDKTALMESRKAIVRIAISARFFCSEAREIAYLNYLKEKRRGHTASSGQHWIMFKFSCQSAIDGREDRHCVNLVPKYRHSMDLLLIAWTHWKIDTEREIDLY